MVRGGHLRCVFLRLRSPSVEHSAISHNKHSVLAIQMDDGYEIFNGITGIFLLERDDHISLKLGEIHVLVADLLEGKRSVLVWTDENGEPHRSEYYHDGLPRAKGTPEVPLGSNLYLTFVASPED